jgi:hypothetical protein
MAKRDRDESGRPRNSRPRDALGRPLAQGSAGVARIPDDLELPPGESLAYAQDLLDQGLAFNAHEVLEAAWKNGPPDEHMLWRGLAQLAVGITHVQRDNVKGAITLLRRASANLGHGDRPAPHAVDVGGLVDYADGLIDDLAAGAFVPSTRLRPRLVTVPPVTVSTMTPTKADLLAAAERSPDAAARHDRAGWVGLFTGDGRVEDPVGSRPHVGHAEIARFYDTFIAPRQITAHRDLDIVHGCVVLRDLDLEITMSQSVTITVPTVLRYDIVATEGPLRIASLRAYWELPAMVMQFLRQGAGSIPAGVALTRALLRHQRLGGTVGFAAGFRRTGKRGTSAAVQFVTDLAAGRGDAAQRRLAAGAEVTLGDELALTVDQLAERLRGATATRMLTAGHTVVISLESSETRAVLFAEIDSGPRLVSRVRYFPE